MASSQFVHLAGYVFGKTQAASNEGVNGQISTAMAGVNGRTGTAMAGVNGQIGTALAGHLDDQWGADLRPRHVMNPARRQKTIDVNIRHHLE